ncbi:hypothetical protein Tco_0256604 [Tanacetum coccineum]
MSSDTNFSILDIITQGHEGNGHEIDVEVVGLSGPMMMVWQIGIACKERGAGTMVGLGFRPKMKVVHAFKVEPVGLIVEWKVVWRGELGWESV